MKQGEPTREEMLAKIKHLEDRLMESEQTIRAIQRGEVDAFVIHEPSGEHIYTLKGVDYGYRILVESINEGALILSSDDSIYYCNRYFAEMLQVPLQQIIGTTLDSYIDQKARTELMELIRQSHNSGRAKGEFQLQRGDGTLLPVNLSLNYVNLEDFHGVCAVLTDLSLQKRTEQELRDTADKLRRSNEELQDFAFIASHDLQEPLRKIQAFGDRLSKMCRSKLDETEQDYLARMQNAANRMQQFIRDLLDYSRLATRAQPLSEVALRDVVGEAISDLEHAIYRTGAGIEIADLPVLKAEKHQLRQLFENLISNSLKFHGETSPRIRIYSRKADSEWQIFVEDNGIGFDEKYLDRIFVPFQRLHGRGKFEGTGMGLAICRKIVERHGGSITAKSTLGFGSTFIITLPLKQKKSS